MRIDLHIRIPDDLHDALEAEAKRLGISLNALVILALSQWREQAK